MFTLNVLVTLVVQILVAALVFGLLWWLIDYTKPPEPFGKVARVAVAVLAVLVVIGLLLALVGRPAVVL